MSRACTFHCPFALTFTCSLIFRRDNYRSDTLERSVIWGFPTTPVLPLLFPLGPSGSCHNSSQWELQHPLTGSPASQPHCFHWCRDGSRAFLATLPSCPLPASLLCLSGGGLCPLHACPHPMVSHSLPIARAKQGCLWAAFPVLLCKWVLWQVLPPLGCF